MSHSKPYQGETWGNGSRSSKTTSSCQGWGRCDTHTHIWFTTPTSFVCKQLLTCQSQLSSFNPWLMGLARWEWTNATNAAMFFGKALDAMLKDQMQIDFFLEGMILTPLQKRNHDKSLFFFWHGITSVDGAEIWLSTWDVIKTCLKNGINYQSLNYCRISEPTTVWINQDLHHFINVNPTVVIMKLLSSDMGSP